MAHQVTFQDHETALVANTPAAVVPAASAFSACLVFNKDAAATVYITDDGSVPSANNGLPIAPGTGYEFPAHALPQAAVQAFSTGTPRVFARWA
jgi:hypothetical protein